MRKAGMAATHAFWVAAPVAMLISLAGSEVLAQEPDLATVLQFEVPPLRGTIPGWQGGPVETLHFDSILVHSGNGSARLERDAASASRFSTITKRLPIDFGGEWVELRGFLRTEDVSQFAGLWMRLDGSTGALEFDNMQDQGLSGTTDWTEYSIRLPLNPKAQSLFLGVLLVGEGTVWADDLQLLVDGKPVDQAPERVVEPTVLDTDREFAAGSGITVTSLSSTQIENVAVLGMVWGFLKYHHPRIASGALHWDYELFRVMPGVLAATDQQARNRVLSQWVDQLGVPDSCDPCANVPDEVHLLPELDWVRDVELLGRTLSQQLQDIYEYRFAGDEHFYVSQTAGVGNPVFDAELAYPSQRPPDSGYRILSVLRLWNIIQYWYPYRDQIDDDWYAVLREFLPRVVAADDWDDYRLELFAFIARIQDTHANLWSETDLLPPRGSCRWPIAVRFIEGRATVAAFTDEVAGPVSGLEIGDVIEAMNGQPVDSLVEAWAPYYCASNQPTRLEHIARFLPRGECGEHTLAIERRGTSHTVAVARLEVSEATPDRHDRQGDTFQLLSTEVAYLKLSSIRGSDVARYIDQAAGTRGLVIDIRNYPSEFVVFILGSRLVQQPTPFARFTVGDINNPGSFTWTEPLVLEPADPGYGGKVVILVDEVSISQAEYTAMAFRAGPQAVVIGSTTAGADGNVSPIPLPGGLQTLISGIGVFYPDKTPTQRVGIVPDVFVAPTIDGIREGRDEVLEAALRHILGTDTDEETIRRTASRR